MSVPILVKAPPVPTKNQILETLHRHNVPLHVWGTGSNRSLEDFIKYSMNDRFHLKEDSRGLIVDLYNVVVIVTHFYKRKCLEIYEHSQEFGNGDVIQRRFNGIAETLRRDESLLDGAHRCLKEELGFHEPSKYEIKPGCNIEKWKPQASEKWPGIHMVFNRHILECEISRKLFRKDGYSEREGDRTIHFKWKPFGQAHFEV